MGRPMSRQLLVGAGLALAVGAGAQAGQYTFSHPAYVRLLDGAEAITVADLDGDGRDDIVALVPVGLVLVLQQPDGSLGEPQPLSSRYSGIRSVHSADLDGDGTMELLVGHSGGLMVYAWNGAGGFDISHHHAPFPCAYMTTADIDHDGVLDVFCQGQVGEGGLYFGHSAGGFSTPVPMEIPGRAGEWNQAVLEDVSEDGLPDLLLVDSGSNSFFVLQNDGARGFLPAIAYPYPEANLTWSPTVAVADIDGDESKEVIVVKPCNNPCAGILVYRPGSDGVLRLSEELATLDIPSVLIAADIDQDSRTDLIVGHSGWHSIGRYMGRENGLWPYEFYTSAPTMWGARRYAIGDVDHDGQLDLVFVNSFGVTLLYGGRRQASDFNGDLVADVVWRHASGRNAIWLSADRATPLPMPSASPAWSLQAMLDSEPDGFAEVFWRNLENGNNATWAPGYGLSWGTGVSRQEWQVVGAGDFDGDDRSDLLWRNGLTGGNTIWLGGSASTQRTVAVVTDLRWKVAGVGDFDADGLSDILWRHASSGRIKVWPAGRKDQEQTLPIVSDLGWEVAGVGDFNGDGQDDIVWRHDRTGRNTIWLSADARRQQSVRAVTNLDWAIAAIGDYNGDGCSDLLWRNDVTGFNVIWRSADYGQQQAVGAVRDTQWRVAR